MHKLFKYRLPLIIIVILLSIGPIKGSCQNKADPTLLIDFFESLYRYDYKSSKRLLERIQTELGDSPESDLSTSNYYWWIMMTGDKNKKCEQEFQKANQAVISRYENSQADELSSDELFAIIHGYAYKTRFALHKKKYIKGLSNLKKILPFMVIVLENPRLNDKFSLLAGLYHYVAASTLQKRPFLRPFFNLAPKSDLDEGYRLLVSAAQSTHPLISVEASYFLLKINLEVSENYYEAIEWCEILVDRFPENILYHYYLMNCNIQLNNQQEVDSEYKIIQKLSRSNTTLAKEQKYYFVKEASKLKKRRK